MRIKDLPETTAADALVDYLVVDRGTTPSTYKIKVGNLLSLGLTTPVNGNINFLGVGNRITGDFTNATHANRVLFQTSTVNGVSVVGVIPNGTGATGQFSAYSSSDPDNSSIGQMNASGTSAEMQFISSAKGTGTFLPMAWYTNSNKRMTLDIAGNLGLGVVPSAWNSAYRAVELQGGSVYSPNATDLNFSQNEYVDAVGYKYKASAAATRYVQSSGTHFWQSAPSGTAGAALTNTTLMTLDNTGNLALGQTPSTWSAGKAIELNNLGNAIYGTSGNMFIGQNFSFNAGYKYVNSAAATLLQQQAGSYIFLNAASGTAGNAISWNTAMTLDASSNLGLGITPSSWSSINGKVLEFSIAGLATGNIFGSGGTAFYGVNYYFNGSWRYQSTGSLALQYQQNTASGVHSWLVASSGTAGNVITWLTAMSLDASSNLQIVGTTGASTQNIRLAAANTASQLRLVWNGAGATYAGIGGDVSGNIIFGRVGNLDGVTSLATQMTLDASGNLGLGVTPSAWGGGRKAIELTALPHIAASGTSLEIGTNYYYNGANYIYKNTNVATLYTPSNGAHTWYTAPSGTAGNPITFTQSLAVGKGTALTLEGGTSTAGTGIAFPATQLASTDANTLDDYEEGTFTPTIAFGGAAVGVTYTTQSGRYTKVGRLCTVNIYIVLSSKGSSVGSLAVLGLPFTVTSHASCSVRFQTLAAGVAAISAYAPASGTSVNIEKFAAGTSNFIQDTDTTNTSTFMLGVSYEV